LVLLSEGVPVVLEPDGFAGRARVDVDAVEAELVEATVAPSGKARPRPTGAGGHECRSLEAPLT
jgi:hypothetical protein